MRILQILPELNQGGVELCVLEIAQALVQAGHESLVISNGGGLVERLEGSQHFQLPIAKKSIFTLWQIPKLIKLINALQPDLIHVHSRFPAWLIFFAQKKLNKHIPVIASVHGLNSVSFYSKIMTRFDAIIAVSQTAKNYIIKNYHIDEHKIKVIYPGVDTKIFLNSTNDEKVNLDIQQRLDGLNPHLNTQAFILLPGRIAPNKGQNDLIAIMQYLKSQNSNIKALIVGGGKKERIKRLQEDIAKNNLTDCLYYFGVCNNMPALYKRAGIVLSLSRKPESYGRTVMEALACAKPVIGYAHGGVKENLERYFPEGLIDVGDVGSATQAITKWIGRDPTFPAIQETLEQTQAQHLMFYEDVIKKHRNSKSGS